MTEYRTKVSQNNYVLYFTTDNYDEFSKVQKFCRDMIDKSNSKLAEWLDVSYDKENDCYTAFCSNCGLELQQSFDPTKYSFICPKCGKEMSGGGRYE